MTGTAAKDYTVVEGFRPGYLGRIAQMHGEYYEKAWGSGPEFEAIMAREICDFCESYNPECDLLLTAHADGKLVGCVAMLGSQEEQPGDMRLRWFLLDSAYQGRGIGGDLLRRALEFARTKGFPKVFLWTVSGLPESRHLYEKAGFQLVETVRDERYTVPHENLRFEREM